MLASVSLARQHVIQPPHLLVHSLIAQLVGAVGQEQAEYEKEPTSSMVSV